LLAQQSLILGHYQDQVGSVPSTDIYRPTLHPLGGRLEITEKSDAESVSGEGCECVHVRNMQPEVVMDPL
ncbi:hypothetical protein ACTXKQ_15150, partial [Corynebacterium variabile]|uniref:hypothetical protein n=1 Tax=Corynebacterium variabile TaxID=1727 RepID=UPI003FCF7FF2